jgi:hypothetical protein
MNHLRPLLIVLIPVLLSACAHDASGATAFHSSAHGIAFTYPGTLREKEADQWESAAGPMYAQEVAYDKQSQGLGDWSLPGEVRSRLETGICDVLRGSGVYLPIDFQKPFVCEVQKGDGAKPTIVLAAGFAQKAEGMSFRQSLMMVLKPAAATLLEGIAPMQPYDAEMTQLIADHPNVTFPGTEFSDMDAQMDALLSRQFQGPSADVREAMAVMRSIALTLTADPVTP